jgi:hypothetical protein
MKIADLPVIIVYTLFGVLMVVAAVVTFLAATTLISAIITLVT